MPLEPITETTLRVDQDNFDDTITIEGVRYSREMFRAFGLAPLGTWLRINARDITVTAHQIRAGSDLAKQFDQLSAGERGVKIDARCDSDTDHLIPTSGV